MTSWFTIILFVAVVTLVELTTTTISTESERQPFQTPVTKIKLPKKIHDISYKGSLFSYSSNNRAALKPIRDYVLESESIKLLEESFVDHLTDTILSGLSAQMKTGVPSMGIPPLDPLRLRPITVQPHIGNDVVSIHLNDIEIHGLSEVDIHDLKPKLNALKVRLALMFGSLRANCRFTVNGTVYGMIDLHGDGNAQLEYTDVLLRTQLSLLHENHTFQIGNSDPPLVDFANAKVELYKAGTNNSADASFSNELGPLLFWVLADHIVQEVDDYLLKYVNNNMLLFKVPESFTPVVTWLMNRNGISSSSTNFGSLGGSIGMSPFQIGRFTPFPFLNQWFNTLSNNFRQPNMNINTRLNFKK